MEEKNRGGCLTAFLIVFIIFGVIGILSSTFNYMNFDKTVEAYKMLNMAVPDNLKTSYLLSIIFSIIQIIGFILVLAWKKLGVILVVASNVISLIISIILAPTISSIILSLISVAITLGIFLLLIKNVYQYLD